MWRILRCTHFIVVMLLLVAVPGWSMIQAGLAQYGNGSAVQFSKAFPCVPVVVTSAQYNSQAVLVSPTDVRKDHFKLAIYNMNGQPISGSVWVQWVAATPEDDVRAGCGTYNHGAQINFPSSLPGCTILTSGHKSGVPLMTCAVNNSANGFGIWNADHNGSSASGAAIYWIAMTPRPDWRCGVTEYKDGNRLSFPATSYPPVIVTCAQSAGAKTAAGIGNSTTGCLLSIRDANNAPVTNNAWVQWWAMKHGVVSDPPGYRSQWGWKFQNFTVSTIPWYLFRDFFGADQVEYSGGWWGQPEPKPDAEEWYHTTYKTVGAGGNCYGMSVSSLRAKAHYVPTYHHDFFTSGPYFTWERPWRTETKETCMEDQGGQLSAEMAAVINNCWYNQTHPQAVDRIKQLISAGGNNLPVMCYWGYGWGHAVVPYKVWTNGGTDYIFLYDNNRPYATNESCWHEPDVATVTGNSFACGGGLKMICLSYDECIQTPHIPSDDAATSSTAIAAFGDGAKVSQVENEGGNTLLNADGSQKQGGIPGAMQFIPLTGTKAVPGLPGMFFFGPKSGNQLAFTVDGSGGNKTCRLFARGAVLKSVCAGTGIVKALDMLASNRGMEISSPTKMRPSIIRYINVGANQVVYDLLNLQKLGSKPLIVRGADKGIEVSAEDGISFDLKIANYSKGGFGEATFTGISIEAGQKLLLVPGFEGEKPTSLNVDIRDAASNRSIRQEKLQPR